MTDLSFRSGRWWDGLQWAVIKDARRRQRRRHLRAGIALAAVAAAALGWWSVTRIQDEPRAPQVAEASTLVTSVAISGATIAAAPTPHALWVLSCVRLCSRDQSMVEQLSEVSEGTGLVIKRFPARDAQSLVVAGGAIWEAHFLSGNVTRIDPKSGRTTATVRLVLPAPVGRHDTRFLPNTVSAGAGKVWVSTARGWIAEIDPRTSRLVTMLRTPSEGNTTIALPSGTWVTENLAGLGFAAPGSHQLSVRPVSVSGQPLDVTQVTAGGGLIWAYASATTADPASSGWHNISVLTAINPRTRRTVKTWRLPGTDDSMAYEQGAAYVGDFPHGQLLRVTVQHGLQDLRSTRGPDAIIAATPGALWTSTAAGKLLRLTLPTSQRRRGLP